MLASTIYRLASYGRVPAGVANPAAGRRVNASATWRAATVSHCSGGSVWR